MKLVFTEAAIEDMAEAAWNLKALIPWKEIPEAWKPFYREQMTAALSTIGRAPRVKEPMGLGEP